MAVFGHSIMMGLGLKPKGPYDRTFHDDDNPEKSADEHALNNASGSGNSSVEKASIVLRGYPLLKAKTTLEITGVGKGSGKWYCKTVVQQWHVDHGYLTHAELTRGTGDGSGGDGEGGNESVDSPD